MKWCRHVFVCFPHMSKMPSFIYNRENKLYTLDQWFTYLCNWNIEWSLRYASFAVITTQVDFTQGQHDVCHYWIRNLSLFLEHLSSHQVRFPLSLVLSVLFFWPLFVWFIFPSFSFRPFSNLCCLSFFDLWILLTPLETFLITHVSKDIVESKGLNHIRCLNDGV